MAKIEVSETVHRLLKEHRQKTGICTKDFVSNLVLRELSRGEAKKVSCCQHGAQSESDVWCKPAFWEK